MKSKHLPPLAVAGAFVLAVVAAIPLVRAADPGGAAPTAPAGDPASWLAKAKADYPLETCVVSGDKLEANDMGGPVDYVYQEAGKPDRLVRFCCKDCIKDFTKDPAKFLKKIDQAAAAKPAPAHPM